MEFVLVIFVFPFIMAAVTAGGIWLLKDFLKSSHKPKVVWKLVLGIFIVGAIHLIIYDTSLNDFAYSPFSLLAGLCTASAFVAGLYDITAKIERRKVVISVVTGFLIAVSIFINCMLSYELPREIGINCVLPKVGQAVQNYNNTYKHYPEKLGNLQQTSQLNLKGCSIFGLEISFNERGGYWDYKQDEKIFEVTYTRFILLFTQ